MSSEKGLAPFLEKMNREELPEVAKDSFSLYYRKLLEGATGLVSEEEIEGVEALPDAENLRAEQGERGRELLSSTVHVVLNGGLGTSMGLTKAKSLLPVRDGMSFLEILARRSHAQGTALVLMNSFATQEDSLEALEALGLRSAEKEGVPPDFVQHKVPKVDADTLAPARWEKNPALEWCPPGHGDIYPALVSSGMLKLLLEKGYRYAFLSNADNLGATIDERILGFFAESRAPFLMEVADRTEADKKGGHLARRKSDGRLILRESAQCPQEQLDAFTDVNRYAYFNTNSIWLDLRALSTVLDKRRGVLGLPMIRNRKTVDPRDPDSPRVYQLETAMGSAIEVFNGAQALRVPRTRFAPVKTTNDLLVVRSDATKITPDLQLIPNPNRALPGPPMVDLDPRFFKRIDDFESRFPEGAPSLMGCKSLTVQGDVLFKGGVTLKGDVTMNEASLGAPGERAVVQQGVWEG